MPIVTDLWPFALAFYGRPGVMAACLRCQDEADADVVMLLFALWQAAAGIALSGAELAAIDQGIAPWRRDVVRRLRDVRRHLKGAGAEPLRELVKEAELEAERHQINTLQGWARRDVATIAPADAAQCNLAAYQAATGRALPAAALGVLLAAFQQA